MGKINKGKNEQMTRKNAREPLIKAARDLFSVKGYDK